MIKVRGVDGQSNVTENFLTMCSLHETTTGKNIYDSLLKALADFDLPLEKMSGLRTDGAPAITGKNNGLIGWYLKSYLWDNLPMPLIYHCVKKT